MQHSRKSYANKCARVRNVTVATLTVTVTPTTVPKESGQIALENYIYVRNVN